jgi:hypothetical protein
VSVNLHRSLVADGPAREVAVELAAFGRFVGDWRVQNALFNESTRQWSESALLWTFDWIIAGRGIQDVLVDEAGTALGTTVRTWDERAGWRVVWFCPRAAEHVVLTAHDLGDRIELAGVQADGRPVKWIFSAILADRFTWDGWCSNDDGETWWHEQHMEAQRLTR